MFRRTVIALAPLAVMTALLLGSPSPSPASSPQPQPPATGAAPAPGAPRTYAHTYEVMGTEATFTVWTDDTARADDAFAAAYEEIRRIEQLMTDWDRPGQPPSDVVRINA